MKNLHLFLTLSRMSSNPFKKKKFKKIKYFFMIVTKGDEKIPLSTSRMIFF